MRNLSLDELKNLDCREVENFIGIENYISLTPGIGGLIKEEPEDFQVWEVIEGGLDSRKLWTENLRLPMIGAKNILLLMKKYNKETMRAVSELSSMLGILPSQVSICGMKDRRAITWQFISIPYTPLVREEITLHNAWIRPVTCIDNVSSKLLIRNNFEIKITHVNILSDKIIDECLSELSEKGIPNFFGYQRFGVTRPITHIVGSMIVKNQIEDAVKYFIGASTMLEKPNHREFREHFRDFMDYKYVLDNFPPQLRYERAMARHMFEKKDDYVGALRKIPLRLRRLFVEAYSSYIFNKALSISIKDASNLNEPFIGDLAAKLDMYGYPTGQVFEVNNWNIEETQKRIKKGEAAIVMPQPGYSVKLPRGPRGDAIKSILEEEKVELRNFIIRKIPEVGTIGNYRTVAIQKCIIDIEKGNDDNVNISLSLPRGSYATAFLREIMKNKCSLAYVGILHHHT